MYSHEMISKILFVLKCSTAARAEKALFWVFWVNILLVLPSLLWNDAYSKVPEHGFLVQKISSAELALVESCVAVVSSVDRQL